jgi:hypothetical protein
LGRRLDHRKTRFRRRAIALKGPWLGKPSRDEKLEREKDLPQARVKRLIRLDDKVKNVSNEVYRRLPLPPPSLK